jgi:hypothetical protein
MSAYKTAHLTEIDVLDDGRCPMRPVRHHFGISTFGATTWTAEEAGDRLINEHDETDMGVDELYLVIQGRARFELDGEQVDAPSGTFVYAPPEVKRTAFAEEAGTTIFAVGGAAPGKPYQVEGWELWAPMMRLFQAGEYAQAADWGLARLEEDEAFGTPTGYYNLACAETLAGRHADALTHLGRAIEMREECREYAAGDSDFDAVRDTPEFRSLMSG